MDEWLKKVQESIGVSQKEQMKKKCEIGEGEQDKFVKQNDNEALQEEVLSKKIRTSFQNLD